MADNAIQSFNPATGRLHALTTGSLAAPNDLALDGATLLIADAFAFRTMHTRYNRVHDVLRAHASELAYPTAVAVGGRLIALSS